MATSVKKRKKANINRNSEVQRKAKENQKRVEFAKNKVGSGPQMDYPIAEVKPFEKPETKSQEVQKPAYEAPKVEPKKVSVNYSTSFKEKLADKGLFSPYNQTQSSDNTKPSPEASEAPVGDSNSPKAKQKKKTAKKGKVKANPEAKEDPKKQKQDGFFKKLAKESFISAVSKTAGTAIDAIDALPVVGSLTSGVLQRTADYGIDKLSESIGLKKPQAQQQKQNAKQTKGSAGFSAEFEKKVLMLLDKIEKNTNPKNKTLVGKVTQAIGNKVSQAVPVGAKNAITAISKFAGSAGNRISKIASSAYGAAKPLLKAYAPKAVEKVQKFASKVSTGVKSTINTVLERNALKKSNDSLEIAPTQLDLFPSDVQAEGGGSENLDIREQLRKNQEEKEKSGSGFSVLEAIGGYLGGKAIFKKGKEVLTGGAKKAGGFIKDVAKKGASVLQEYGKKGLDFVKKNPTKVLKGAAGAGSLALGVAGDYASEKLKDNGYEETGKAVGVGTSALSGAALGATVGSVVPVVGTAVGGAVGGLIGAGVGIYDQYFSEDSKKKDKKPQDIQPVTTSDKQTIEKVNTSKMPSAEDAKKKLKAFSSTQFIPLDQKYDKVADPVKRITEDNKILTQELERLEGVKKSIQSSPEYAKYTEEQKKAVFAEVDKKSKEISNKIQENLNIKDKMPKLNFDIPMSSPFRTLSKEETAKVLEKETEMKKGKPLPGMENETKSMPKIESSVPNTQIQTAPKENATVLSKVGEAVKDAKDERMEKPIVVVPPPAPTPIAAGSNQPQGPSFAVGKPSIRNPDLSFRSLVSR